MTHYTLGELRRRTANLPDELPIIVRSVSGEFDYTDAGIVARVSLPWTEAGCNEPLQLDCLVIEQQ